jgi:hypothetical protein
MNVIAEALIFIPIVILFLPIGLVFSIIVSAILLIPGYVIHVYVFIISKRWWNKQRVNGSKS